MDYNLETLSASALTNMEAGQLIHRLQSDLATIDPNSLTDLPYNNYVEGLANHSNLYEMALAQVQKNEETEKIVQADGVRDKAISALGMCIRLYALSDEPDEVEASRSLGILFGTYKNLAKLNYEAETLGIDKLISELSKPNYSQKVNFLQMDRYVTRLSNANDAFKTLFSGRMVTAAMTETFDLKSIRIEMLKMYSEFTVYVLAMAKALNTPLFITSLNLLNATRRYYSDLLARRTAKKEEQEEPVD